MSAQKRKPYKRSKSKGLTGIQLIFVLLILLAVSALAAWYILSLDKENPNQPEPGQTRQEVSEEQIPSTIEPTHDTLSAILSGSWVSEMDGSILSFQANDFSIESASVEESQRIRGSYSILGKTITIVYDAGTPLCESYSGKYFFELRGDRLIFQCKQDACGSRKELFEFGWFQL